MSDLENGLSVDDIRAVVRMDRTTGFIYWTGHGKCRPAGKVAGHPTEYRGRYRWVVGINRTRFFRSRIVFALTHNRWPSAGTFIDHINGDSMDDRPENLREATPKENARNRTVHVARASGLPVGVTQTPYGRYRSKLKCDGRWLNVGTYDTPELAYSAYREKRKELFGDFA